MTFAAAYKDNNGLTQNLCYINHLVRTYFQIAFRISFDVFKVMYV